MSDDREIIGVPSIGMSDDAGMAAIDDAIAEVAATIDQGIKEKNEEPEETNDDEVSKPITNTETNGRVYNLCKGKNGNRGHEYSYRFRDHLMALVHIALTQLSTKSGL